MLIVGALVHRLGSKERCQKKDLWMMNALEESHGINLAWVIAEHLCKHALRLKENSLICGGHYVTKISNLLGYLVNEEVRECLELIKCKKWTTKMLANELDFLNEIEHMDVWRDSMLMRNNYMLEHSMPILYHFADQANFAYLTYEPLNIPPYPYPYVPYPHPYTHYTDMGNQPHGGGHYGAPGDGYFACSMPNLRGTFIVPSSGYEVGGSSRAIQDDDDDASMSE
ncbi:hypothetical protein Tco_1112418 [Tanacetum coccineum]|uniref:Uncharacterized protein n=1 Tax=Tanacetum coccineum TaxID=301880 RepID=A0ABQ5IQS6_9ASTR